ncbi:MAG TPA: response regulator transcription factor, partial [Niabella sp.]
MEGYKILIADDEPDILDILSYNLIKEGYHVITAKDGEEAIEKSNQERPHLIILDMMMPKKTGVQVCQVLRAQTAFKDTLIMFLTALNDESTQIRGLETGADDYVSKPVSPKVLSSRVAALLRRIHKEDSKSIKAGPITIDPEKFIVQNGDKEIILAKKEF